MATIGRAAAVARIGRLELSGLLAWLAWLLVHVFFLIGFRNRVAVILQWAWSYLTFKRGARLITDTAERWRLAAERRGRPAPEQRSAGSAGDEVHAPAERDDAGAHGADDATPTSLH
jgi:NADH dehydrogenase